MNWCESAGSSVIEPVQRGFGSAAMGALLLMSLQGEIDIEFAAGGPR